LIAKKKIVLEKKSQIMMMISVICQKMSIATHVKIFIFFFFGILYGVEQESDIYSGIHSHTYTHSQISEKVP